MRHGKVKFIGVEHFLKTGDTRRVPHPGLGKLVTEYWHRVKTVWWDPRTWGEGGSWEMYPPGATGPCFEPTVTYPQAPPMDLDHCPVYPRKPQPGLPLGGPCFGGNTWTSDDWPVPSPIGEGEDDDDDGTCSAAVIKALHRPQGNRDAHTRMCWLFYVAIGACCVWSGVTLGSTPANWIMLGLLIVVAQIGRYCMLKPKPPAPAEVKH